jgi:hypothetical protein
MDTKADIQPHKDVKQLAADYSLTILAATGKVANVLDGRRRCSRWLTNLSA